MPTFEFVKKFIETNFENVSLKKKHFHAKCRLCGDSKKDPRKKRFHLDFTDDHTIAFHCFNCNASGNFIKLFALVHNISYDEALNELESFDSIRSRLTTTESLSAASAEVEHTITYHNDVIKNCLSERDTPTGFREEAYIKRLQQFRASRYIPDNVVLYIAMSGHYANRIIIPVIDENNNILYFQARALTDKIQPKYLNPAAEKYLIIPGYSKLKEPVIITEGLVDSFMLGENGTCCLGKEINESFVGALYNKFESCDNIIIALDNDRAGYEALLHFLENNKWSSYVKYFLMPKSCMHVKDINELKIEHPAINIIDFIVDNSCSYIKTKVKLQLDKWRKHVTD